MFRLVRRLAVLSALSVAFSSVPLSAQSQPGSPDQSAPAPSTNQPKAAKKDNDKPIHTAYMNITVQASAKH